MPQRAKNIPDSFSTKALSFLTDKDIRSELRGPALIGWTKSEAIDKPESFIVNKDFEDFMHKVISDNLEKDETLVYAAQYQKEGWFHIPDFREPAPTGRIPTPDNIFGSVKLDKGKMLKETYERMPAHRMMSAQGLFKLSEPLHALLVKELQKIQ
eukprot:Colp12_sorted_trinity150504_noHs@13680